MMEALHRSTQCKICLLLYYFIFVQGCQIVVEQGEEKTLYGNVSAPSPSHTYTWTVYINNTPVTVSTCSIQNNCTDFYPESFQAEWEEPSSNRPYKTKLLIESVNISMTQIILDNRTPCSLEVFVPPEKPVCSDPVFVESYVTFNCTTGSVYPKAYCYLRAYYMGPTQNLTSFYRSQHNRLDNGLYSTDCTFYIDARHLKDGELYDFSGVFFPNVTDGERYQTASDITKTIFFEHAEIKIFTANTQGSSIDIAENTTVTFDCEATGHPEGTLKLVKGIERYTIINSSDLNNLTYSKVLQCGDMDKYICQVDNGLSTDEAEVKVYVKCPLRLKDENYKEYAIDGNLQNDEMVVHITGYPQPINYTLQVMNDSVLQTIPHHKYQISVTESTSEISVQMVTLTFLNGETVIQDAWYFLTMNNGLGELQFRFTLTAESNDFPVLAVVLGVCGGVLFIIAVVVCAFYVCHRRGA